MSRCRGQPTSIRSTLSASNSYSALAGPERPGRESETKLEVESLFQAPNYDIVYQGPVDTSVFPVGTKVAAAGRDYTLLRIRALNGATPLVVGFPSENASMVAEFIVPILER